MAVLPTAPSEAKTALADYSILIYGPPKIGKTTFAASMPAPLFLATEPGHNALTVSKVDINSWSTLLAACSELADGKHDFKTIVVDTIGIAYQLCLEKVSAELGVKHPADMDYGKGWAAVNNEFERVLRKLAGLPYGLVMIAHSRETEIKTKISVLTKITPDLTGGASRIATGLCDMIFFADFENKRNANGDAGSEEVRVVRTRPSRDFDAGDRTGRLPAVLPLDYSAIAKAFSEGGKPG